MGNRSAFTTSRGRGLKPLTLALLALALPASSATADFPPITAPEKALTAVAGEPNAPAVVLYRKGVFQMEHVGKQSDSIFTVQARIKVLTEAGKEHGEIVLPHDSFRRLKYLKGRTVLPDGKVLELSEKDVFKRQASRLDGYYATAAALPGVEVGAILDYEYQLRYRSLYRLVPWHFQSRIPTLHSEISYVVPEWIGFRPWAKVLPDRFHQEIDKQPKGRTLRAWMKDMPSIPEEPFSFPFGDLSNQFMILPTQYQFSGRQIDLLTSWPTVCDRQKSLYYDHRKNDGKARKKARELAATAGGDKREQAAAVYRFVRDGIQLESLYGIFVREGASVDSVISQGRGDEADKALVLQSMLEALKISTDLVWVADRAGGKKDLNTPNPGWFDRMIVRVDLGGETVFLDPSDRRLGFGYLPPGLEGTEALLYHSRKPEVIQLPVTPWQENRRRAVVDLALDDEGRLGGSGSLQLAGHHAWEQMRGQGDAESAEAWREWLEGSFSDFTVTGVEVSEAPDERRIQVSWSMQQPEEEVLGDEASLRVSRPLGIGTNPFKTARRNPVRFSFTDRDQVELSLTWPEAWRVDVLPRVADFAGPVGAFIAGVDHRPAERLLSTTWRVDVVRQELTSPALIAAIGELLSVVENADGQNLVLVRRP